MGDGRVALILDVLGVAHAANVLSQNADGAARVAHEETAATEGDKQTLLLFKLDGGGRIAVPLSTVARLEEFDRAMIEEVGGRGVVQYRGAIMPLINVAEMLGDHRARARARRIHRAAAATAKTQVVVFTHRGQNVGLMVEQIVDIVQESVQLDQSAAREGVLGTAVIKEKVTELLDITAIVKSAMAGGLRLAA